MRAMISWFGMGGGGFDGKPSTPLDGEEPSRFSIRAASASEFIEIRRTSYRSFSRRRGSSAHNSLGTFIVDAANRAFHGLGDAVFCQINLRRIQSQRGCDLGCRPLLED